MEFAQKLMERTGKGYLSYSALKYAADGSRNQDMKLFELYMKGLLKKKSDALYFGSLYDTLLLEPETLTDKFYVLYDEQKKAELDAKYGDKYKNPRASKVWKEEYDEWYLNEVKYAEGKEIVIEEWMVQAESMIVRLDESEVLDMETGKVTPVRRYLQGNAQYEINDWIEDVPVRGFLDIRGDGFISDSKTTRELFGFRYDVGKYDYDIQAYIYTQVEACDNFYWVAQTKSVPYTCAVYKASKSTISRGEYKFWSAVENIRKWLNSPEKDTNTFAIYSEI
jgi:hypothetical protein